ncbi:MULTISPECIES: RelA/SpoT family protein [Bradyrhizobium]|uniref:GTP pyrophosphokinase rsh n=10 Tax=Bradyrhizobium TaxID=374 RepID=A0ABS5GBM6_9BRAD|nr:MULTISPECIES: bifunctional (p)ppGpp synthetase/guanosine-3',5'-bis(diphosphate) 3'-pyrophosphohydrolase [Bradyrhizobium]RTM04165.1 MAG: bifunctional (p)ppGpp synthetase/guanosine-3',5'-bis(diphosphate) 3'-pyrophosphohydrolase [Bradyrhizobiaceae bacterium]MBR1138722.1 bifunctional (p)ppGpp synthetase/guanosine-3',5'-bis(diphosphate) 3'-pyrophosphohydrolase [Bradyrhizobium denitrificans]MCL8485915.1 bifunctional (p)ppGpp synthetase/guanosine-3',5'-bis(diphosphate) 3'-pyrophosphohydrolase [Brady
MAVSRHTPPQMQAAAESAVAAPTAERPRPQKPRSRMMRQYDLVERVRSYNPDTNEDLLNRAYVYAMKAHGSQTRASGDPYFTHPLEVAAILTDLKLDDATIVAALLHDTIEDTEATRAEIDRLFGPEIGALVEGLTKLKRLELVSREAKQAENLRKLLLAIADDVRVLLVKLADRLHNMRTLEFVPEASRRRIAEETLDIYAPLAGRMGMQEMREELEDLSFRTLDPQAYDVVMQRLDALAERNRNLIGEIESQLARKFRDHGLTARVFGRRKRPFSIWTKMERKSIGFEQLSDIFGFRVIMPDLESCYRALGIVHTTWPVVPGRFKDYISTPKQNDYRSIHTTVIGPGKQRVELQIRTEEMDQIAELGIAAHAFYKDDIGSPTELLKRESNAFAWLRHTIGILSESANPEEFLEHTKLELFHDQVFCFTPKGKLIALPRHANVIDFAYAVHTDVGNSAVGCKINGKFAALSSELQNGDEVEVLTSDAQSAPPSAWETLAVTGKARAAIRRATRTAVRDQYAGLGRRIVERLFERTKLDYADDKLKGALPRLARASIEDVMAAVGRGEIKASDVARAMYPDYKEERIVRYGSKKTAAAAAKAAAAPTAEPARGAFAIPISGLNSGLPVKFAPNGGAVPGDRIVGIVTPGEGITIYPIQSPALKDFEEEPERWLDVRWDVDETTPQRFPARIRVENVNEPGSLAQVATVIAEHDGNIDNISMSRRSPDFTELTIDLEVYDLKHLSAIINQLRAKTIVARVDRVNG